MKSKFPISEHKMLNSKEQRPNDYAEKVLSDFKKLMFGHTSYFEKGQIKSEEKSLLTQTYRRLFNFNPFLME